MYIIITVKQYLVQSAQVVLLNTNLCRCLAFYMGDITTTVLQQSLTCNFYIGSQIHNFFLLALHVTCIVILLTE